MYSKINKRIVAIALTIVAALLLTSFQAFAAASGTHTPVEGVTVGVSGATDNSMSNGAVTVTAKGSGGFLGIGASAKTATITVYNESGSSATVSFDWTASSVNELKIDGAVYSGTSDSFSKLLDAGASFTITITTAKNGTTNKLVMSNFSLLKAKDSSNVTFDYNSSLGSITAGGNTVPSGTTQEVSLSDGIALVATPNRGSTFLGWINETDNTIYSTEASYTLATGSDVVVIAAFASADTNAWFMVNSAYLYDDLAAAITKAGSSGTIVLMSSGTLPANKSYNIPSGVKLLIPNSASDTGAFGPEPSIQLSGTIKDYPPTAFRTLIVPPTTTITCYGEINVNGHRSNNGQPFCGTVLGNYGKIILGSESTTFSNPDEGDLTSQLIIEDGGKLYCYGYITGSGMVDVKNGGTVHELFQIGDWPGGSNGIGWEEGASKQFLISQYYVQNIEAPLTIHYGGTANIEGVITASSLEIKLSSTFIGTNAGLFHLKDASSSVLRIYDQEHDRIHYHLCGGTFDLGNIALYKWLVLATIDIDTANSILPLTNNLSVYVESGATLNAGKRFSILPGAEVVVEFGGTVNLTSEAFIYDVNDWNGNANSAQTAFFNRIQQAISEGWAPSDVNENPQTNPLPYVATLDGISPRASEYYFSPENKNFCMTNPLPITVSGSVVVNGTLNVGTEGIIYTTTGGNSDSKVIVGTGTINYSGTIGQTDITVGTEGYEATVNAGNALSNLAGVGELKAFATGTYYGKVIDGVNWWYKNSETVAANCVTDGYTKYYCDDEANFIFVPTGELATGKHTWGTQGDAKCLCSVCKMVKFYATNINLGNDLGMLFAIPVSVFADRGRSECEVVFIRNGNEVKTIPGAEWVEKGITSNGHTDPNGKGYFIFTYDGFAAKEMCDEVTVIIRCSGETISQSLTTSIRGYAMRLLKNQSGNVKLRTMIVDMLNYGAACQVYFANANNNPELANDLANAQLTEEQKAWASPNPGIAATPAPDSELWAGSQLVVESNIIFKIKLQNGAMTNATKVSYSFWSHKKADHATEDSFTIGQLAKTNENGEVEYILEIDTMVVADADSWITIEITYEDGSTKVFTERITNYINRMSENSGDNVYMDFLKFAYSARAYLNSKAEAKEETGA